MIERNEIIEKFINEINTTKYYENIKCNIQEKILINILTDEKISFNIKTEDKSFYKSLKTNKPIFIFESKHTPNKDLYILVDENNKTFKTAWNKDIKEANKIDYYYTYYFMEYKLDNITDFKQLLYISFFFKIYDKSVYEINIKDYISKKNINNKNDNKSNFKEDLEKDRFLTPLINGIFFYNFIHKYFKYEINNLDFKTYKNEQYQGIDTIVKNNKNQIWKVDVKCQTSFINNPTNTFCLELYYKKGNDNKVGWFIDNNKDTDYYLFVWFHKVNLENINGIDLIYRLEQLQKIEFMLIKKKDIEDYLNNLNWTKNRLKEQVNKMVKCNEYRDTTTRCNGFWFTNSKNNKYKNIAEQSINLIMNKETYLKLPNTKHYWYINKTFFQDINNSKIKNNISLKIV